MAKFKKGLISEGMELKIDFKEYFPKEDSIHVMRGIIEDLDISAIESCYSEIGQRAYPPRIMLRIIFYGYSQGIRSGEELAKACQIDIRFIFLSEGLRPKKSTINDFRRDHHKHFSELFKQVVQKCIELELTETDTAFHDGSKIRANASAKRGKTKKQYEKWLARLEEDIAELSEEIKHNASSQQDQSSDTDLSSKKKQLKQKQALAQKISQQKDAFDDQSDEATRINLTDPDAHFMKGKKKYKDTFYNPQLSVSEQQIILHNDVCTSSSDKHQLIPAIEGLRYNTECMLEKMVADPGYSCFSNETYMEEESITGFIPDQDFGKSFEDKPFHRSHFQYDPQLDQYICPQNQPLTFLRHKNEKGYKWRIYQGVACSSCPCREKCTKAKARTIARELRQPLRDQMRQRLQSDDGLELYAKRKHKVEPVFGHLKHNLGYNYFLLRGLDKVKAEFNIMCIAYNLMKIANNKVVFSIKNLVEILYRHSESTLYLLKSIFQRTFGLKRPCNYIYAFY